MLRKVHAEFLGFSGFSGAILQKTLVESKIQRYGVPVRAAREVHIIKNTRLVAVNLAREGSL